MFSISTVIFFIILYLGSLFLIALWTERKRRRLPALSNNATFYALSLAVYCTTWTFYGSVGSAARSGYLYLASYLGPTLAMILGWSILRRMIRLKNKFHLTSIADLVSTRFSKSQLIGGLTTIIAVLGAVPYIALQFKALIVTFILIIGRPSTEARAAIGDHAGLAFALIMLLFAIAFGLRRVTSTERHPGIVTAMTAEALVKLVAFLSLGLFVFFHFFETFGNFSQYLDGFISTFTLKPLLSTTNVTHGTDFATWINYVILSFFAFLFLPRQFHLAVVENTDENHLKRALWLLPTYLFLISLFVIPIAMAGILLDAPLSEADHFVLTTPLFFDQPWFSLLIFIGGLAAGTGTIIIETMAISTMLSNHIALPLLGVAPILQRCKKHILPIRWISASLFIAACFFYERTLGAFYDFADIGLIAFSAILTFTPEVIAALYWRPANKTGAVLGMTGGLSLWAITILLPTLVGYGVLPRTLLTNGIFGLSLLRPEALLGVSQLPPLVHATLWILGSNIALLFLGSLLSRSSTEDQLTANRFLDILSDNKEEASYPVDTRLRTLPLFSKVQQIEKILLGFFDKDKTNVLIPEILRNSGLLPEQASITVLELATLQQITEKALAAAIGTPAAHSAIRASGLISKNDQRDLSRAYGELLTNLAIPPSELSQKIDYYKRRESILLQEAATLKILEEAGTTLGVSIDTKHTIKSIIRFPIPELATGCLLYLPNGLDNAEDTEPAFFVSHLTPGVENYLLSSIAHNSPRLSSFPHIEQALRTRRTAVAPDDSGILWNYPPFAEVKIRSSITLPLIVRGSVFATLSLFSPTPHHYSRPEDISLIEEIGRRCSNALDNANLYASAQEAIRAREEFLSIASHELRTPLTSLRAQIQLLSRLSNRDQLASYPSDKLNALLVGADGQMERLTRLITELLNISRARQGKLALNIQELDLGILINDTVERFRPETTHARCTLHVDARPGILGQWDRIRIEEVISNLLTNAIKYGAGSDITVKTWESDKGMVYFSVRDVGIGIPPKDHARIFRRFERASRSQDISGFGLGLYIAQQIVLAHGGMISVQSQLGSGSTFTVELPRHMHFAGPPADSETL